MIEDKKLSSTTMQNIHLENREKLNISGVKDVLSFDDQMVILETELGLLTIKGENLRINKLSIDTLDVSIDGTVNTLVYSDSSPDGRRGGKPNSFLSKLFK
ncbi:MAG: sporulation protein YabP [Clostridia bacterium]|nr:sporulation protein YabP [Clostridia bacterium]